MDKNDDFRIYPLSLEEAAKLADVTPAQLRDLVRCGRVPCLLLTNGEWFNHDDITEHREIMAKSSASMHERRALDLGDALRAYLTERPPLVDYDEAIIADAPVLARALDGTVFAHVQPGSVVAFAQSKGRWVNVQAAEAVRQALTAMGSVKVRGIRPLTGGKQRWNFWFRVPLGIWSMNPEHASLLADIGGTRHGEQVKRTAAVGVHLTSPMQSVD